METGDAFTDSLNKINNGFGGSLSWYIERGALMHKWSLGDLVKSSQDAHSKSRLTETAFTW